MRRLGETTVDMYPYLIADRKGTGLMKELLGIYDEISQRTWTPVSPRDTGLHDGGRGHLLGQYPEADERIETVDPRIARSRRSLGDRAGRQTRDHILGKICISGSGLPGDRGQNGADSLSPVDLGSISGSLISTSGVGNRSSQTLGDRYRTNRAGSLRLTHTSAVSGSSFLSHQEEVGDESILWRKNKS